MKVLIAEDDEDQLAVRKMLLDHSGFDSITASDGASALRAARAEHPACAVIDLRLPTEEQGLTLIRDLKRAQPKIHIFLLTGANRASLNHSPEMDLIDDVIEKGSPAANLIQKLTEISLRAGSISNPQAR